MSFQFRPDFVYHTKNSVTSVAKLVTADKEVKTCIGKANAVSGKLKGIWKNNGCSLKSKIHFYDAIVLSTLLYVSETWPVTVANKKY